MRMQRCLSRTIRTLLLLGGASVVLGGPWNASVLAAPAAAVAPFLYPPYPGTASEESIFDHTSPNYSQTDNRIVSYGGHEARKNCPSPQPPGSPPPQAGVCDQGYGIYWSYDLAGWMAYNGHDGIDYGISYRPVYAAADADRVMYSGWWDPQNHEASYGIYVRLHHSNGYVTTYGHMSAIAVQACPTDGCASIAHGEMLGISGTTGNSTGPHLHFSLTSPAGKMVDPYGWGSGGNDPWPYDQTESLWVMYPSLVYYGVRALPSGNVALPYPSSPATGILIDDSSTGFVQSPAQCWNDINVNTSQAQNGNLSYSKARLTAPTCTGQWRFLVGSPPGQYGVYIRIPSVHGTTMGAVYTIQHAAQTSRVSFNPAAQKASRGAEVAFLRETPDLMGCHNVAAVGPGGDFLGPAGARQPHLGVRIVTANKCCIDIPIFIDLGSAQKADIHVTALQVVGEDVVHADHRQCSADQCRVANGEGQPGWFRPDDAGFVDHYQFRGVRPLGEVAGQVGLSNPNEDHVAILQEPCGVYDH